MSFEKRSEANDLAKPNTKQIDSYLMSLKEFLRYQTRSNSILISAVRLKLWCIWLRQTFASLRFANDIVDEFIELKSTPTNTSWTWSVFISNISIPKTNNKSFIQGERIHAKDTKVRQICCFQGAIEAAHTCSEDCRSSRNGIIDIRKASDATKYWRLLVERTQGTGWVPMNRREL